MSMNMVKLISSHIQNGHITLDYTNRQPTRDNLFKAIGFDYFGPFDGHDVTQLVQVFNALKNAKVHV